MSTSTVTTESGGTRDATGTRLATVADRHHVLVPIVCAALLVLGLLVAGPVQDASAATPRTAVWIGSPTTSTWPNAEGCAGASYPSASCSLPYAHHTYNYGDPYPGDVGWDQQRVASGQEVRLYAAPNNTAYNNQITAHVLRIVPACAAITGESASARIARGGYAVVVEIRHNGTPIGTVKYVHVQPAVGVGQVARWGTLIGRVGSYTPNRCWGGLHLHVELLNYANYACYNKGWKPGQQTYATNFVGFIGGAYASGPHRACP